MKLIIKTDNDAFVDYKNGEIARILQATAKRILEGDRSGNCYDHNGNKVGEWKI